VQQSLAAETHRRTRPHRPRIIIVEDEAMIAIMLEYMLEDLGCEVAASFGDLPSAMSWLNRCGDEIDGALLDVNLAGQTVFPIADLLYAKGKPFGFITSYTAVPQARSYHARVLNKPVDTRDLRALVTSFSD
jgi:two-component SAPR family response regulator